ncbi:HEPN domain-containing protein [Sedimentibacter sp.]|uniref:HEPN domain-containing protein n=1 Tax=Sedimentibacter sp. TaxID=1960295 RepID=UPI0028A010BA|nr:HEPN domain-containing protein [Sedimentibacter sp.]
MNSKIQYWMDLAEYDIETAKAMLQTGRYLYVGFMCHQTIEKALKAVISKNDVLPPKTHGLMKLAQLADIYELMNESKKDLLDTLDPLNVAARYPEQKDKLAVTLTQDRCKAILEETEDLLCWIKKQL